MLNRQYDIKLSPYRALYDKIVPENNVFRRMADEIDFCFVMDELEAKYSNQTGRNAVSPIQMIKYLIIKVYTDLSDRDVVEQVRVNMAYKYFLDLNPEDEPVDHSSLSVFRRTRLKDTNILDLLIKKTVEIALEKKIIKKKTDIIVDSTHTLSPFQPYRPLDYLKMRSKKLRQAIYSIDEDYVGRIGNDHEIKELAEELEYTKKLLSTVKEQYPELLDDKRFILEYNKFEEAIGDVEDHYTASVIDKDARVGHKTSDTDFFGFKSHIAITKERIIVGAVITSGEKSDTEQAQALINKVEDNDLQIDTLIGDGAYSSKEILESAKDKFSVAAPLNPIVFNGNRKPEDRLEFNKDAGRPICKAGHIAVKERLVTYKSKNQAKVYTFDKSKCECCKLRSQCNPQLKNKTYSIPVHTQEQEKQMEYQQTDRYKEKMKHRYKIEAKNAELKQLGYGRADSYGLEAMTIQAAMTMFFVNIRRIFKLKDMPK